MAKTGNITANGKSTRKRRDPSLVFSETACRSARQAASLAAKRVADGSAAPPDVLQAMSQLQGVGMIWLISSEHDQSGS